jgi:16S rRNA (adenine1518-N6/adenine1519-N6)-dimethyltransferase
MDLDLTNSSHIAKLLQSHGLHARKSFGQHFLINRPTLGNIIHAADIQSTDTIIEIGAGIGVLTQELAKHAGQVISFEIDTTLQPVLGQTVGEYSNLQLIFQDFLQANLNQLLPSSYKLVANLPYNAGSHILDVFVKSSNPPQSITVLLQKEVAQKITATPPHATYLSNFFQVYGSAQITQVVPPTSFFPPPKVDSAVLHILQNSTVSEIDPKSFSSFLHRGFAQPRKMLNKSFTKDQLLMANIDPSSRPENLTFNQWRDLSKTITN